jgi:hypothetical protein
MKIVRRSLAVILVTFLVAPAAQAQTHVVAKAALTQAVQERVGQDQADRDAIRSLLARSDVRQVAQHAGLSIAKAEAAVSTLQGQDLRDLASQARQVNDDLAAGASTIVISTTTVIIVLLVVILIIVAVN